MNRYHMPQKLIITQKGQELLQEVQEQTAQQKYEDEIHQKREYQLKKQEQEKLFQQINMSQKMYYSKTKEKLNNDGLIEFQDNFKQIQDKNTPNDMINAQNSQIVRQCNKSKDISKFLLPQSQSSQKQLRQQITPYLQRKLELATKDILKIGGTEDLTKIVKNQTLEGRLNNMTDMNFFKNNSSQFIKKHGQLEWFIKTASQKPNINKQNNSTLNQSNYGNFYNNNSLAESQYFNNSVTQNFYQTAKSNQNKKLSLDEIVHERANKMVFYESKFSKLFENYKKQKQNLGNLRKSKNTLDVLVKKAIDDENKGKGTRAETLKEIQEQLPGSLDILDYVNNQKIREKEYILENHVKQYAKKWQKSHFPMSNNERQKQGLPKISYKPKLNVIKRNYSCKGKKDGWVY